MKYERSKVCFVYHKIRIYISYKDLLIQAKKLHFLHSNGMVIDTEFHHGIGDIRNMMKIGGDA